MEQIRIIKEMRKRDRELHPNVDIRLIRPRYMVWKNVCGAFSSNKGEDFRAVLEETAKVVDKDAVIPEPPKGKWTPSGCIVGDGWSIAWRVHDAQFWGVPQRRKRISLVADFGGTSAPEILFERKSLSGNTSESGEKGQGITTDTQRDINKTEPMCVQRRFSSVNTFENGITPTLEAGAGEGGNNMPMVCESLTFQERARKPGGGKGILIQDERTGALSTLNNQSVVYGMSAYDSNSMKSSNPHSGIYEADTTRTLDNNGGNPACNQGGMMVVQGADVYNGDLTGEVAATLTEACGGTNTSGAKVVCLEGNGSRPSHQGDGYAESEISYTLNAVEQHAVCVENHPQDSRVKIRDDGICQTLDARMGMGGGKGILIANERTGLLGTSANQFVCGVDNYNQAITGNVSKPLTNKATDSDHIPCVCYSQDAYDKYAESDTSAAIKQSGGNYGGGGSESLVACVQEIIRE